MSPEEKFEILERLNAIRTDVQKIDRVLSGEPEYRREGLVQIVDRHELYLKRGAAIAGAFYVCWEAFKFFYKVA